MARGLELHDLKGPFQPQLCSMILYLANINCAAGGRNVLVCPPGIKVGEAFANSAWFSKDILAL